MSTPAESAARVKESLEQAARALSAHYGREVRPRFHEAARQFGRSAPAFAKVIEPLRRLSGDLEAEGAVQAVYNAMLERLSDDWSIDDVPHLLEALDRYLSGEQEMGDE